MKLQELSRRTGTPVSTVKYWLREGLLHPGAKRNATTAVYDAGHVERLELITTLRQVVGLPVEQVRTVVDAVRDPDIPPAQLMGITQATVLDLPTPSSDAGPAVDPDGAVTASGIIAAMGWTAGGEAATAALDAELRRMADWGLAPDMETALVYARAADQVADFEMELPPLTGLTRDRLALFVARGVFGYAQLLQRLLAVAQSSAALRAAGQGHPPE
ncbi:MerR family transcriptional regulator [Corynebacterium nuruki]|uniref:MerR family transcriptional regulator n=1 Tax=Corynebacterium nuruki TaxID=1032851 RepID=UPI0039BF7D56